MATDYEAELDDYVDLLAEVMIRKHCTWLNLHVQYEAAEHPTWGHHLYRSSDFSEANQWGWRKVVGRIYNAEIDPEMLILTVNIHDGDEGGSQTLTGFFDAKTVGIYRHYQTEQEARTDEIDWGQRGGAASWNYVRTELEGWDLSDMIQEFDTMRTQVLKEGRFINTPDDSRLGQADDGAAHEFGRVEGCEACGSSDDASSASSAMQIDVGKG